MGDLISRQDAIKNAHFPMIDDAGYEVVRVYDILALPSARPKGEWIPCSERLPENEKKSYWICTDAGYQCECRWTNVNHVWTDLTIDWHWHICDVPQYSKVLAWMPLPEPYKGEYESNISTRIM